MCGGTFKSRGRKRKAKPKISYKEQKERRIRKKFGVNGIALGADDEKKVLLEKGRRPVGAPSKFQFPHAAAYTVHVNSILTSRGFFSPGKLKD